MKTCGVLICAALAGSALGAVATEKVDTLLEFFREHENADASTDEGERVQFEFERRRRALSDTERAELDGKLSALMKAKREEALKRLLAIPVDTPAASVDRFEDDTNCVDAVFGVPFGTRIDRGRVVSGTDAGPLELLVNETRLKIPRPVKWFTTVSGQPDHRNCRIFELTFKGEIAESVPQSEVDRGVRQLADLMAAKFGREALDGYSPSRDFNVRIHDTLNTNGFGDIKQVLARTCPSVKVPRSVTLTVENRRISKLDPEIPYPKSGDHFADELRIPEGLDLSEPYSEGTDPADLKGDFTLVNGMQGGIYRYSAKVAPGEDGEVYLRA